MPKLTVKPIEPSVRLILEQQGDSVLLRTEDNWNILFIKENGVVSRCANLSSSLGFDVDADGRVIIVDED